MHPIGYLRVFIILALLICSCQNRNETSKKDQDIAKKQETNRFDPNLEKPTKAWISEHWDTINAFYYRQIAPIKGSFSGQFLVAKNGHIVYSRCDGFADKLANRAMTDTTPIHVASISKVATALAVMRLVADKRLRLDDDVSKYLPGFPYRNITVRSLLNHRSGIPYYGYFTTGVWDPALPLDNKGLLALICQHSFPLQFEPNTQFSYSNTNFSLLALIIEKVTGKPFPSAMNELIFKPLEMNHTFILSTKAEYEASSKTYRSGYQPYEFEFLDGIYGDKNLYTTAKDLVKLDLATYSDDFLPPYLRKQVFKGYSYEKSGRHNYGLGYRLKEEKGKQTFFFHTGWWHGNTCIYGSLRSQKVTIIALSNVYTKRVWGIAPLVLHFGNYPFRFIPSEQ